MTAPLRDYLGRVMDTAGTEIATDQELTGALSGVGHNPKLRAWYAGLAGRYASPARVLVMGDSNAEGTGATTFTRRWQAVLQAQLRGRFQPPGVLGAAVPYMSASPRMTPLPTASGVATAGSPALASFGLGLRALTVNAGQSVTFTFTGDRCKLLGTKGPSAGRYNIALNGAAGTVVDGFNSGTLISGAVLWDSGALTRGTHTVVVTRDAGTTGSPGSVFPEGLATYDGDHDTGIRVVDGARHGATLSVFTGSTGWANAMSTLGPHHLLLMPWGANDSTSGTTPAAFQTGLSALIGQARAGGFAGSILLVGMPKRGNASEATWAGYLTAMQAISNGDPDIAYLDMRSRMPDQGTAQAIALDINADEVHYKDKGQGWVADQIATFLTPR